MSKICEYIPNISKIYEQVMFKQIFKYFETILSKNQCGFRKGFSVQLCLLAMLKNGNRPFVIRKDLLHSQCIWVSLTNITINTKLFIKEKTKNKD